MKTESKILIVDDIAKNIQMSMNILKNEGYKMFYAKSGTMALELIKEHDFDFSNEELDIRYKGLEDDEIEDICKELKAIAKKVSFINSKIELSLGQSPANYMKLSLDVISDKLSYFTTLIDDIKHDYIQDS